MTPITSTYHDGEFVEFLPRRTFLPRHSDQPEEVRINGKCCACKARFSALVVETRDGAQSPKSKKRVGTAVDARSRVWYNLDGCGYWVRCDCGKCFRALPVVGKLNPGIKRNARCESATGHVCECSCGGKNHGAGAE